MVLALNTKLAFSLIKRGRCFLGLNLLVFFFFNSRSQYLARDSGRADLDIDDFVAKFIVNNLWCLNQYFFLIEMYFYLFVDV